MDKTTYIVGVSLRIHPELHLMTDLEVMGMALV